MPLALQSHSLTLLAELGISLEDFDASSYLTMRRPIDDSFFDTSHLGWTGEFDMSKPAT